LLDFPFSAIKGKNPPNVIEFYMESLCPYCIRFTTGPIKFLLEQENFQELAIVNFIPFGNAEESQKDNKYTFECQHGEAECRGNLIETCAVKLFDNLSANKFIVCLETNYKGNFDQTAQQCLASEESKYNLLLNCLSSDKANEYQHEMAEKTNSLQPAHEWVPWVVVDGVHDGDISEADDLVAYLCSKRSDKSEIALCNKKDYSQISLRFLSEKHVCPRN
jgi:interferon gamma-inducible protein 30